MADTKAGEGLEFTDGTEAGEIGQSLRQPGRTVLADHHAESLPSYNCRA